MASSNSSNSKTQSILKGLTVYPFLTEVKEALEQQRTAGNKLIIPAEITTADIESPALGVEVFTRMYEAIATAEHEVLLAFYKITRNTTAEQGLIDALKALNEKAKKQSKIITVKFLTNNPRWPASFIWKEYYNSAFRQAGFRDNVPNLRFEYAEHNHRSLGSFHSKMVIIDGKTSMIGTGEPDADYGPQKSITKVNMLSVLHSKSAAQQFRGVFQQAWNSKTVHTLNGTVKTPIADTVALGEAKEDGDAASGVPVLMLAKKEQGDFFSRKHLGPYITAVIMGIKRAQNTIRIITPNLNIPKVLDALVEANSRGVAIQLVVGRYFNQGSENVPSMGGNNEEVLYNFLEKLKTKKSTRLDKIDIRWASNDDGSVCREVSAKKHVKLVCIDDDIVMTGSSPLDIQAAYFSRETDVVFQDATLAKQYHEQIFNPIFQKGMNVLLDHTFIPYSFNEQAALNGLLETLGFGINLLENKRKELSKGNGKTKHATEIALIDEILGKPRMEWTTNEAAGPTNNLYKLQDDARNLSLEKLKGTKTSAQIQEGIITIITQYRDNMINAHDQAVKNYQGTRQSVAKILEKISDFVKYYILGFFGISCSLSTPMTIDSTVGLLSKSMSRMLKPAPAMPPSGMQKQKDPIDLTSLFPLLP